MIKKDYNSKGQKNLISPSKNHQNVIIIFKDACYNFRRLKSNSKIETKIFHLRIILNDIQPKIK